MALSLNMFTLSKSVEAAEGGRFIIMAVNGMALKHMGTMFDVFDTIPLIPLQPLPGARPPQLMCHQPPVSKIKTQLNTCLVPLCSLKCHSHLSGSCSLNVPDILLFHQARSPDTELLLQAWYPDTEIPSAQLGNDPDSHRAPEDVNVD